MSWNDPSETLVAGTGQVYVGDVGSTLPTDPTSIPTLADFSGLGLHSEDGVAVANAPNVIEHMAWQSKFTIRRDRDLEGFQVTFALLQWNEINLPLAFGGGEITNPSGSVYKYTPPAPSDAPDERALIVDVQDGSRHGRFIIPRGTVTDAVDSQLTRNAMGLLPITFQALEPADESDPWYFLIDDAAAFASGS